MLASRLPLLLVLHLLLSLIAPTTSLPQTPRPGFIPPQFLSGYVPPQNPDPHQDQRFMLYDAAVSNLASQSITSLTAVAAPFDPSAPDPPALPADAPPASAHCLAPGANYCVKMLVYWYLTWAAHPDSAHYNALTNAIIRMRQDILSIGRTYKIEGARTTLGMADLPPGEGKNGTEAALATLIVDGSGSPTGACPLELALQGLDLFGRMVEGSKERVERVMDFVVVDTLAAESCAFYANSGVPDEVGKEDHTWEEFGRTRVE